MSDFLNPALDELRDQIAVAWPAILKNDGGLRFWRGEHLATLPLERVVEQHGLPLAVLVASEAAPAGIDGAETYEFVECEVYYLDQIAGRANGLLAVGQVLRDALWPDDPLTLSQVCTRPKVSVSLAQEANRLFRSKKEGLYSVGVSFRLLTGEPAAA
jgi:hypothetical protein